MVNQSGGFAATGVLTRAANAEARDQNEEGESEEFHVEGVGVRVTSTFAIRAVPGQTWRTAKGRAPSDAKTAIACQMCDIPVTFVRFCVFCKLQNARVSRFSHSPVPQEGWGPQTRAAECCGALVGANPRARTDLAQNTLLVFTSDNGFAQYVGAAELEKMGYYPSGPLREYKADVWEGGHLVPFIVRWPAVIQPETVCGQLVQQADLMATFAEALGVELPENVGVDSFSLLPLLKGGNKPVRKNAVNCSMGGVPGVRQGEWKLIRASGSGGWGKGGDQSQPVQLYNLAKDLGETKNLAADQPERVAQM
jgi:hypothetical protein